MSYAQEFDLLPIDFSLDRLAHVLESPGHAVNADRFLAKCIGTELLRCLCPINPTGETWLCDGSANLLIERGCNARTMEAKMTTPVEQSRPSNTYRTSVERYGDTWLAVGDDHDIDVPCSLHIPPCQVFFPGHCVHWVQVNLSSEEPHLTGTLAGVAGDLIAIDFGEETAMYRNHEAEHLFETVELGGTVQVCNRCLLLSSGESYFSIVDANKPLTPCKYDPLISTTWDALAERLKTHGGYTVPGRELPESIETRKR